MGFRIGISLLLLLLATQGSAKEVIDRTVELRGIPKSGTTWLEVALLALFSCHSAGSEETPELAATLSTYSRQNNSFKIVNNFNKTVNFHLDVNRKHKWSSWKHWTKKTQAQPDFLTVVIFRDPKDTALSFADYSNNNADVEHARAVEKLNTLLTTASFSVDQLLAGQHVPDNLPDTFFVSYELSRFCAEKTFWALSEFLGLPAQNKHRCIAFAKTSASLEEMNRLEEDRKLPGMKLKKVRDGKVCRSFEDHVSFPKASLPEDWMNFFGEEGECTMTDSISKYSLSRLPGKCDLLEETLALKRTWKHRDEKIQT